MQQTDMTYKQENKILVIQLYIVNQYILKYHSLCKGLFNIILTLTSLIDRYCTTVGTKLDAFYINKRSC